MNTMIYYVVMTKSVFVIDLYRCSGLVTKCKDIATPAKSMSLFSDVS